MIDYVAQLLPSSLARKLVPLYVAVNSRLGTNYSDVTMFGEEFRFEYRTGDEFILLYNMIEDGTIAAEGISLDYLDSIDECDAFLDVGAHHGLYSLIVGAVAPTVHIYSFEPNDRNRNTLTQMLSNNGVEAEIREEVVTDETGKIVFYERDSDGSQGHSTAASDESRRVEKPAFSLSKFIQQAEIDAPFLKIDAEGEEYNILKDLFESADTSSVRGLVEVHPDKMSRDEEDIVTLFDEHGCDWEYVGETTGAGFVDRPAYYFSRP